MQQQQQQEKDHFLIQLANQIDKIAINRSDIEKFIDDYNKQYLSKIKHVDNLNPSTELTDIPQQHQNTFEDLLRYFKNKGTNLTECDKSYLFNLFAQKKLIDNNNSQNVYFKDFKKVQPEPDSLKNVAKLQQNQKICDQYSKKASKNLKAKMQKSQRFLKMLKSLDDKDYIDLDSLNFDLQQQQCLKVARISKKAFLKNQKGIYFFITYLKRSISNLQQQKKTPQGIQQKLRKQLEKIQKKQQFQSGELPANLTEQQIKNFEKKINLNAQQKKQNEKQKKQFLQQNKQCKFQKNDSPEQKLGKLEKKIKQQAKIAQENLENFLDITEQTCYQKSIYYYDSNLKLNLKDSQEKQKNSIERITEKLLFKQQNQEEKKMPPQNANNIQEIIKQQKKRIQQQKKENLQQKDAVTINIDDMLRGKCVFEKLDDIKIAIDNLKQYQSSNPKKLKIIEIKSRFLRKKSPLSDVKMQIIINQQILAQLQLTLQKDSASYQFGHKMYQFDRTQLTCKIHLIVENYYNMYTKDQRFPQLFNRGIDLCELYQTKILKKKILKQFFEINPQHQRFIKFQQICKEKIEKQQNSNKYNRQNYRSFLLKTIFVNKLNLLQVSKQQKIKCRIKKTQNATQNTRGIVDFIEKFKFEKQQVAMLIYQLFREWDMSHRYEINYQYQMATFIQDEFSIDINKYEQSIRVSPNQCIRSSPRIFLRMKHIEQIWNLKFNKVAKNKQNKDHSEFYRSIYGEKSLEYQLYKLQYLCQLPLKQHEKTQRQDLEKIMKTIQKSSSPLYLNFKLKKISNSLIKLQQQNLQNRQQQMRQLKQEIKNTKKQCQKKYSFDDFVICTIFQLQAKLLFQQIEEFHQFKQQYESIIKLKEQYYQIDMQIKTACQSRWRIAEIVKNQQMNKRQQRWFYNQFIRNNLIDSLENGYLQFQELYPKLNLYYQRYQPLNLAPPSLKIKLINGDKCFSFNYQGANQRQDKIVKWVLKLDMPQITSFHIGCLKQNQSYKKLIEENNWQKIQSLAFLNISKSNFEIVYKKIAQKFPNIKQLTIQNQQLQQDHFDDEAWDWIADSLCNKLQKLIIIGSNITEQGFKRNYQKFIKLKYIDLGKNTNKIKQTNTYKQFKKICQKREKEDDNKKQIPQNNQANIQKQNKAGKISNPVIAQTRFLSCIFLIFACLIIIYLLKMSVENYAPDQIANHSSYKYK